MTTPRELIQFFISYRREDAKAAQWVKGILQQRFRGRVKIFLDNEDINRGDDYRTLLQEELNTCNVMIVIIGTQWEKGPYGESSIAHQDDWIHKEISVALNRGIDIYPILFDRTSVSYPDDLSGLNSKTRTKLKLDQLLEGGGELAALFRELDRLADTHKRKPLAFVTSTLTYTGNNNALDGLDYFTTLMTLVLKSVNDQHFDVVLKVPEFSSDDSPELITQNQIRMVSDVLDHSHLYEGLIVAPYEVLPLLKRVKRFREGNHNFPIAAIDKGFIGDFDGIMPSSLQPLYSVENNGYKNGQLAGNCLAEYLIQTKISQSNVIIMQGREGSESRIKGFIDYVKRHKKLDIEYRSTDPMDFTKHAGKRTIDNYLDDGYFIDIFTSGRPKQVHAFFCCNDEIALGARLALDKHQADLKDWEYPPVIIGFDGIRDFTSLLEDQYERFLLNTIDTNIHAQVNKLIEVFVDCIDKRGGWTPYKFETHLGRRVLDRIRQSARAKRIMELHKGLI